VSVNFLKASQPGGPRNEIFDNKRS
jgi:hypothetical protein